MTGPDATCPIVPVVPPAFVIPAMYLISPENKAALDWLFRLYGGELHLKQVPSGARVENVNCLGVVYAHANALVWGKITWTLGRKIYTDEFEEIVLVRPRADS